jgi:hypothetical protein
VWAWGTMVEDIGRSPFRGSFHQNLIDIAEDFGFEFLLQFLHPSWKYYLIFQELFQPAQFFDELFCWYQMLA